MFWVFFGRLIQEDLYAATAQGCGDRVEWRIAKINALFSKVHYTQTGCLDEYAAKRSQKHPILFTDTKNSWQSEALLPFRRNLLEVLCGLIPMTVIENLLF
ncbi:hypothetical protein [Nitrosomonas sp.]|uniref:hypothetical protein n=1 Tax=Nitrosomonas sp. TaxID=42353 RepID=UPI002730A11E|nr:hypothetical protein [Nitrosomonas sp.]